MVEEQNNPFENFAQSPPSSAEPPISALPINGQQEIDKDRIWSAITVPLIAIGSGLVISTIALFAGMALVGIKLDLADPNQMLADFFKHPLGIWLVVLPGQLTFFGAAVLAAILSPLPTSKRLNLSKSKLPVWTWFVFLLATPCVGLSTSFVIQSLGIEPSMQIEMLEDLMTAESAISFLICMFLIAVVPSIAEEFLFRGYLQARLLKRWAPWAAILFSAFVFAIAHLDPVHVLAVFPLGIWFGVVAHRCGSIWPAMILHFGNNLMALVLTQFGFDAPDLGIVELSIIIPSVLAMVLSLVLIFRKSTTTGAE